MKKAIDIKNKTILVTGAAGFIGHNLVMRLIHDHPDIRIIGIDNFSDYYDISLKEYREDRASKYAKENNTDYRIVRGSISDKQLVEKVFSDHHPQIVVNLAAQAGVRYSIDNPDSYIDSNIIGFFNILEASRHIQNETKGIEHLVYASSSSVYGGNEKVPFSVDDMVDNPFSLYAATKKSNELFAYCYSKLYGIPSTGLRFFTVYGPAGRPDMAYFSFADRLCNGQKIDIFNYGNCKRDFTYIDDIVEGILRVIQKAPEEVVKEGTVSIPPYSLYNIGHGEPVGLMDFVKILSDSLIKEGALPDNFDVMKHISLVPMQPGDVPVTYADTTDLEKDFDYRPQIDLQTGLKRFAKWYAYWKK